MRTLTLGLMAGILSAAACGSLSTARAADLDYDVLRGADYYEEPVAAPVIDWSGVYVGVHGGYSSAAFGFKNVFQPIVANALRATVIENEMGVSSLLTARDVRKGGGSFGGYAGYNFQFEDTVVGVEFDYTRFDIPGSSSDAIARSKVTTDGYQNFVSLSGTSSTQLVDFGTVRGRAGYAIGSFLPFVTGGLAIGRAQIRDTVAIQAYGYDRTTYQANLTATTPAYVGRYGYSSFDQTNPGAGVPAAAATYGNRNGKTKVVGGFALGAGLEYAITPNILLRGEYQYVLLNDFDGHKVNVNTVRGGAAVKF